VGITVIFTYFRLRIAFHTDRHFNTTYLYPMMIALYYCTRIILWASGGDRRRHVRVCRVNDSVGVFYFHRRKRANRGPRQYNNTYHYYYYTSQAGTGYYNNNNIIITVARPAIAEQPLRVANNLPLQVSIIIVLNST